MTLYHELCSYKNLRLAYKKARKHKTTKKYVIEFENNLEENLQSLRTELLLHSYRPRPLETFILRDPKTRKISKSDFRDRVVHHALINIIEPIFEKIFIHDSYANRKRKGTHKAIERLQYFSRKTTRNNTKKCYVLKADIKNYFDTVDHKTLIDILKEKIKDRKIIFLIKTILQNHKTKEKGKGMPLGNLTSQFFANVYLNKLDYFIKHKLRLKYYIRYVDDFIILYKHKRELEIYKNEIDSFLEKKLKIKLHEDKTHIRSIYKGVTFLGLRIFAHHKLLKKTNIRIFRNKFSKIYKECKTNRCNYDIIYDFLEGWFAYAKNANTYNLRKEIIEIHNKHFRGKISEKEINKYNKYGMKANLKCLV